MRASSEWKILPMIFKKGLLPLPGVLSINKDIKDNKDILAGKG